MNNTIKKIKDESILFHAMGTIASTGRIVVSLFLAIAFGGERAPQLGT